MRITRNLLLVAALLLTPAAAQDVVHLKSGERLAGKLTDGMLEVQLETAAGTVRIPWSKIDRVDRAAFVRSVYEDRAAELSPDDAAGHFLLALWCRRQGLGEAMGAELQRALEAEPDHAGARSALGFEKVDDRWVAGAEIPAAKGFVRIDGRWVLPEEKAYAEMAKERDRPLSAREEKAEVLIVKAAAPNPRVRKYARTAFRALEWKEQRIPLFRAMGSRSEEVRRVAAEELGRIGEEEAIRPLLRSAVLDRSPEVRASAVSALREFDEPEILFPLARALASGRLEVRTRATEAIGGLGDVRGVGYLVKRLSQNWGSGPRNNIQVMNQVAYIQDFDVEIAQAAQIGDPIIGVLKEGVILDVQVLGVNRRMTVVERRAIRSALTRLTGVDLGDDPVAWADWWKKNGKRLLEEAG